MAKKPRRHESRAKVLARERRDAARRLRRSEARKRRDAARRAIREEQRKRRRAIRKAIREAERKRKDALRRLARELAREKRDAARALLRKERRALLRQRYVVRMTLNSNGTWSWYRVSGPTYQQASMAVRGQKGYYPIRAERRLKSTKAQSSQTPWTAIN
jgi:hypothetical protein